MVNFNPVTHSAFKIFAVVLVKYIVFGQFRGVKIDVAARQIGIFIGNKLLNHSDKLGNTACRRYDDFRYLDVEFFAVFKKCIGVKLGYFHNGFALSACSAEHFVLARVGIACKMPDIGDVHDTFDLIADIT